MDKYKFSKERRREIEFIFNEFNKNKNGLNGNQLLYLLKSIGIYLNNDESASLLEECKTNGNLNLNNFYALMQEFYYDENIGKMLLTALQAHTKEGSKTITFAKLKHLLMTLGTGVKLTEDEIDSFLNVEFNHVKNMEISFDEFIYKVLKE
ncbi:calmodulin-like protein, putative [Plasmodium vinckei vinckei]|uniref:Calmodulin n=1 Tax=Plasmodium vinckei vinckei TaxID=54757 RepID=A0A449BQR8_PLAVN|nr:calmodulin-like protein, putative [Plasmodium vinckei vinckei]VEV55784.1 calmodulin-like protein, putative [Plasmodium vinckei vinckei]